MLYGNTKKFKRFPWLSLPLPQSPPISSSPWPPPLDEMCRNDWALLTNSSYFVHKLSNFIPPPPFSEYAWICDILYILQTRTFHPSGSRHSEDTRRFLTFYIFWPIQGEVQIIGGRQMIGWILHYNPISLISVMVWTALADTTLFYFFSLQILHYTR